MHHKIMNRQDYSSIKINPIKLFKSFAILSKIFEQDRLMSELLLMH